MFAPERCSITRWRSGCFVGVGNPLVAGAALRAEDHMFGLCLVNDWSARDMQSWEYQPLGPFLAKNFATTVSPWVVTLEALEPFRMPAGARPEGDPGPLPYLADEVNRARGGVDMTVEVLLSQRRRCGRAAFAPEAPEPRRLADHVLDLRSDAHASHRAGAAPLRPGDLFASGTVSGPERSREGVSWS